MGRVRRAADQLLWVFLLRLRISRGLWPGVVVQGLVVPAIFLFVLTHQTHRLSSTQSAIGIGVISSLTLAMRRVAQQAVADEASGRNELLRASAVSPIIRTVAQIVDGIVVGWIAIVPMSAAIWVGAVAAPRSLNWIAVLSLALFVFAAFGTVVASLTTRVSVANLITSLLLVCAACVCPLFYGEGQVPALLRPVVDVLPPTLQATGMWQSWSSDAFPWGSMRILVLWAIGLASVIACRTMRPPSARIAARS